ncbi:hypothetical protein HYU16_02360 [Candidatus Woesearchaeota archaeon]|nr:hypothetical protein [Candidatus Woesearchaeota archaeon]
MVQAAAAAAPIPPSGFGRLMQGMIGVGSKLAPALGVARAATPAVGGAAQGLGMGAGFAVGQAATAPVKGIFGWFADLKPENLYSGVVVFAVIIYIIDFLTGFDIARTAQLRWIFALGSFFVLMITGRYIKFWSVVIAAVQFYSLYGTLNLLQSGLGWVDLINPSKIWVIVLLLGSGVFYVNLPIPGAIKWLPVVIISEIYGLPIIRDKALDYFANAGYLAFIVAFALNRVLFPIPLIYSMFAFYSESKTARKLVGALIIFYLIASLPQIKGAYNSHAGLSPEEKEVAQDIKEKFLASARNILSGEFLRAPTAAAYEGLERTFGFGEPKEEPKMGLQLRDDPNMPKVFDLGFYSVAAPSVIMEVPNPLPVDTDKKAIRVVGIDCEDESGSSQGIVVEPSPEPTADQPVLVSYRRPRTAKCEFPDLKEGSNSAKIKVKYGFEADAEMSTAFMRSDKVEALIAAGEDPADKIPPARAEYDNGPVSITWGPVELVTSPASVSITANPRPSPAPAKPLPWQAWTTFGLVVYVGKSGAWEGEIASVNSLELRVPEGITLISDYSNDPYPPPDASKCSFIRKTDDKGNRIPNEYVVKPELIKRTKTDGSLGDSRFIGDGVAFTCKMIVPPSVLAGTDWVGADFKVALGYVFSTEKAVSFEIQGCDKGSTQDCMTDKNCAGTQTCNNDGAWGPCDPKPGGCPVKV